MLDSQGRVKLTDFGVARITDSDRTSAERTQAGTVVGTPAYMSPEQIEGQRVDRRSDIFSAGIILYQFLTGQKPFTGEGAWTVARKILQEDPPMPSTLNVEVPREYDRVVAKALTKNPEGRFATAREFAAALRRATEGKQAIAEEAAAPTVVLPPRKPPTEEKTASLAGAQSARKNAPLLAGLIAGAALAAAGAYFYATRTGAEAPGAAAPRLKEAAAEDPASREAVTRRKADLEAEEARIAARLKALKDAEARAKAKHDADAKAERDARTRQQLDARAKLEADAQAKQQAEAQAKAKQEADARAKQEAEAKKRLRVTPTF
jgi:serine/threonine-protein kinase